MIVLIASSTLPVGSPVSPLSGRCQTAARRGVYILAPFNLRSYWTDAEQIFTRCSQIIYIEPFEIGAVGLIVRSVLQCQAHE